MKYWSLSQVAASPEMPTRLGIEWLNYAYLVHTGRRMSRPAFDYGMHVVRNMDPEEMPLVVVEQEDAPPRRLFLDYPTIEQWMALERGGVVEDENTIYILLDALH